MPIGAISQLPPEGIIRSITKHVGYSSVIESDRVNRMTRANAISFATRLLQPSRSGQQARVWLAIFSLLTLLFMPVGGVSIGSQDGTTLVEICTKDGAQQITIDVDGKPIPPPTANHCTAPCPFCLAHAGFALVIPGVEPPAPTSLGELPAYSLLSAVFVPAHDFLIGRYGRAPPHPIV